jgi:hypothetical protein
MQLNLPIVEQVNNCKSILIAGMGDGFDVLCGLPIYLELCNRGFNAHLANFSFANIRDIEGGKRLTESLVGVNSEIKGRFVYFPELYLSRWFQEFQGKDVTIWCFHKTGTEPLHEGYQVLINHLNIDSIILVDGGVDSLMRGDESAMGTILEDDISLNVVNRFSNIKTRLMASIGFGAEQNIAHAHVLENIATFTRTGGFLGSCSLTSQMEAYQLYESAVLYVQSQLLQDPSVINSSIISAVQGHYGDFHLTEKTHGSKLWISPLMPIYWFFDLPKIASQKMLLQQLSGTQTAREALEIYATTASIIPRRPDFKIPLT